jgi:hypothetical protein
MTKYLLTTTQTFEIETDDIRTVLDNMEFSCFNEGVIGDSEFIEGTDTYEIVGD